MSPFWFYHDNGTKINPFYVVVKLTKIYQNDRYKNRDVKSPYKLQSTSLIYNVEVTNLISDDEDVLPARQTIKTASKTINKHGSPKKSASSIQKEDRRFKKKARSISSRTAEQDGRLKRKPRSRDSRDQGLNGNRLTRESSTSSNRPAKAIGIRIPARVPHGWVDYAPKMVDDTDQETSSLSESSTEAIPSWLQRRKRVRQLFIIPSSSASSSEIDEGTEASPLKKTSAGVRNYSTTKALSKPELPFIEDGGNSSALENRESSIHSPFSPILQSWRVSNTELVPSEHTKALSRIESFTRYLAPASSSPNRVDSDLPSSKKRTSKPYINNNVLNSEVNISRGISCDLYSSDSGRPYVHKPTQNTHNRGTTAEAVRGSSAVLGRLPLNHSSEPLIASTETKTSRKWIARSRSSKEGTTRKSLVDETQKAARTKLRDVQFVSQSSSSSSESDLKTISKQEQYISPNRGGLRPRFIKENESQKKIREWKLKYNNHPFVTQLNSLRHLKNTDIVNELDDDPPPSNFKFISKNVFTGQAIKPEPAAIYGCFCEPNCNPKSCICIGERNDIDDPSEKFWGLPYNVNKHLTQAYLSSPLAIHECNAACSCSSSCRNRNVTLPHDLNLEIFKTVNRGWGLRSRDFVFKGQFVDTYRGEVLTDEEAEARSEQSVNKNIYLFTLDKFASELPPGEKEYVIDAEFKGSPARFINHSCDPNLSVFCVSLLRGNPRVYELVLFAIRDILPGEEMSFDYQGMGGDDDRWNNSLAPGSQGEKVLECLCGAPQCRRHFW